MILVIIEAPTKVSLGRQSCGCTKLGLGLI